MKKTVVFDFDGVIHSYTSGWQGAATVTDSVVPGIQSAINSLRQEGYEVVVVSTRCATPEGMGAVRRYLRDNHIVVDEVMKEKPPAICYVDDRAICFDGNAETLVEKIKAFKPWNSHEKHKCETDKGEEVKNFVVNYEDGSQRVIEKGFFCQMKPDGEEYILDFIMADVAGPELEYIVYGCFELGKKLGMFGIRGEG